MLITKFNKLIRSRILWTILAVVVAFAFVGASVMSKSGCSEAPQEQSAEGRLFGRKVTGPEFYASRYFEMGLRPMQDTSDEAIQALRVRTWRRLAALRMADRMGLQVTDADIRDVITSDPTFASNGAFDQQRYIGFLQNQLDISAATFESYLRQDLTLRKLMVALRAASWTTPYEMAPRLARLTDSVQLEYVIIPPASTTNDISLSDDEITAYFAANSNQFEVGQQLMVRYVAFPVSNLLDSISVAESTIDDYYNAHIEDYSTTDTNGIEHVQPLDEVRESMESTIRATQARFETKDEATQFVMALAPDRYGQAYEMTAAAAARGLTIGTSEWFTASDTIPGLDGGPELTDAAFRLVPNDPERYFSDAIAGESIVYVLADSDSRPARIPVLDEVRAAVVAAATLEAAEEAFRNSISVTRDQLIAAATDPEVGFMRQAKTLDLLASTTSVFTVYEGLPDEHPYGVELLGEIIDAKAGEITEAVETEDGMVIAHVISRRAGDPSAAELLRPQFLRTMDQYRAAAVYQDWLEQVMNEANFEDFHPIAP
ncbi:MAG: SurA N-terminal domain-containing protein [Lentisphaerae bacterium]|nr:SurA N-terminal domain-containing protein [Lentisphaerota bacterium]